MTLRAVDFKPQRPDIVGDLKELLAKAERGEITDFSGVFVEQGAYAFYTSQSWLHTMATARLLEQWALRKVLP